MIRKERKRPYAEQPPKTRNSLLLGITGLCGGALVAGGLSIITLLQGSRESQTRSQQVEAVLAVMTENQSRYIAALEKSLNQQPTIVVNPPAIPSPVFSPLTVFPYGPTPSLIVPVQPEDASASVDSTRQPPKEKIPEPAVGDILSPEILPETQEMDRNTERNVTPEAKTEVSLPAPVTSTPVMGNPKLLRDETPVQVAILQSPVISREEITRVVSVQGRNSRVMIDAGSHKGIQTGARFTVWREGQYIGELMLRTLLERMSACEITSVVAEGVRVGDEVRKNSDFLSVAQYQKE